MKIILSLMICLFIFACNTNDHQIKSNSDGEDTISPKGINMQSSPGKLENSPVMFTENNVRATGNEPFWMLELKNDSAHFKLMGGFEFRELLPAPEINSHDSLKYHFNTASATVTILIEHKECIDDMSGFKSPFTASIIFTGPDNTQNYHGCADYESAYDQVREPEK